MVAKGDAKVRQDDPPDRTTSQRETDAIMGKSNIQWTQITWNNVTGCVKVSPGCKGCYAKREWPRFAHLPAYVGRAFEDVATHPDRLGLPFRHAAPKRIFVNSMSDQFEDRVPFEFLDRVFAVMALNPQHTFQILTKRPERMRAYFAAVTAEGDTKTRVAAIYANLLTAVPELVGEVSPKKLPKPGSALPAWPLPNVWLGVSAEDQEHLDLRVPILLDTPAAVRWVSLEPLLAAVSFRWAKWEPFKKAGVNNEYDGLRRLDWIVVGGESGPNARPMALEWVETIHTQCTEAGVAFLFKQWGEWVPGDVPDEAGGRSRTPWPNGTVSTRVGTRAAGRLLHGRLWDGYPMVRATPAANSHGAAGGQRTLGARA